MIPSVADFFEAFCQAVLSK